MVRRVTPLVIAAAATLFAAEPPAPRGNTALTREAGKPLFSFTAALRLGVLLGGGAEVMQRVGFGAGFHFRYLPLAVHPVRFGLEVAGGHTRFLDRVTVPTGEAGQTAVRYASLGHTDFTAGPVLVFNLRAAFLSFGATGGLALNYLVRPQGPAAIDEEDVSDVSGMVRGFGDVGIPIRNNHGIVIGQAVQIFFSNTQVVASPDPSMPDLEPNVSPFDLALETSVSYRFWF